ncbi:hypothetical protein R1flu_006439 [Riccia fluitans]|uniref:Uncharacterized protein n=1 Tax=Riccia fluitans TaxID=41844 RepID=A0ABD1YWU8_9MARC
MAIQPVIPTRLRRPPTVGFEELSLLTRDEVFRHLKFDHLKTMGILFIDGNLFAKGDAGPQGQLLVNISREGLKEYLDFPCSEDSSCVVRASVIEISFRLNHRLEYSASTAKFREGWQAVFQLLHMNFFARMARQIQEGPLLMGDEPRNAFGNTQA